MPKVTNFIFTEIANQFVRFVQANPHRTRLIELFLILTSTAITSLTIDFIMNILQESNKIRSFLLVKKNVTNVVPVNGAVARRRNLPRKRETVFFIAGIARLRDTRSCDHTSYAKKTN